MKLVYNVQDLVKCYPKQVQPVNDHITLQIYQGEIFGILGDNGAGKTTLVRQMVNLQRSTSGTIELFGQLLSQDALRVPMYVGYMPQQSDALNHLTVGEALFFTAHLRGLSRSAARKERDDLLLLWEMEKLRDKYSSRLSGGQKRLLRLAVSMAGSPPVLVLDEPTNDLDPQKRKLVWDVLRRVNDERGTTIIFITHDAVEAEKIIQRVGILREGKFVALGNLSAIKSKVDKKLRLELFFAPEQAPTLPTHLVPHQLQPGHWLVLLDWHEAGSIMNSLQLDQIQDLRLYTATLEDVYLYYATEQQTAST